MEPSLIIAYVLALVIGAVLGLLGGGGSILTVPVMVYIVGVEVVEATSYSLFVVGISSLVGVLTFARKGQVNYLIGIMFGIPSVATVYATRKWILPAAPDHAELMGMPISKDLVLMVLFAVLMILASFTMIRNKKVAAMGEERNPNLLVVFLEGIVVGFLTGLVGAGGGFLIVPALVVLSHLPMKTAVGTSLLIISGKSLIGFMGDIGHVEIDWMMLSLFSGITICGIFVGSYLSNLIKGEQLKPVFGWFILIMGICILAENIINS